MLVHTKHDFRVRRGVKRVAQFLEQRTLFAKVIQLAVINYCDLAVGRAHWLMSATADVNDREPRHAEDYIFFLEHAAIVWTTMMHRADHYANFFATFIAP